MALEKESSLVFSVKQLLDAETERLNSEETARAELLAREREQQLVAREAEREKERQRAIVAYAQQRESYDAMLADAQKREAELRRDQRLLREKLESVPRLSAPVQQGTCPTIPEQTPAKKIPRRSTDNSKHSCDCLPTDPLCDCGR